MNKLENKIDNRIEEGYNNQVYLSHEGTVIKRYRKFSIGAIGHVIRGLLIFQNLYGLDQRIKTEYLVRDKIQRVNYPKIIAREENWIEFEKINGKSFFELLEEENVNPKELGNKAGNIMQKLHDQSIYMTDWALDDILLEEDEVFLLDFEFASIGENALREKLDEISIFSQLGNFDLDKIRRFISGFKNHKNIGLEIVLTGFFVSFAFNLVYCWGEGKPVKVLKNLLSLIT